MEGEVCGLVWEASNDGWKNAVCLEGGSCNGNIQQIPTKNNT